MQPSLPKASIHVLSKYLYFPRKLRHIMKVTQIHPVTRGVSDCGRCTVRENSLFSDFTDEDFRLIQAPIEDFRFAPGAVIYKQGDKVNGLYSIRSGMVKLNRLN